VFVGDEDAIQRCGARAQLSESAKSLAFGEAGVNQEARVRGFEQRAVARTARRQNRNTKRDALPPCDVYA
jgi:hypothetical protein